MTTYVLLTSGSIQSGPWWSDVTTIPYRTPTTVCAVIIHRHILYQ